MTATDAFHYSSPVEETGGKLPATVVMLLAERDRQLEDYLAMVAGGMPAALVAAPGDLTVGSGSGVESLTPGADGSFLAADSSQSLGLLWRVIVDADLPASIARDAEVVLQTLADAKGDIVAASAADTWTRLAAGANDTLLRADSTQATGLRWGALVDGDIPASIARDTEVTAAVTAHEAAADPHPGYVLESLVDAKGDLYAASADNTVGRVPVGTNGQVLTADAAQSLGVKWATPTVGYRFSQGPWTQTNVAASQSYVGLNLN